jgi:phage tail-like protein
MTIYLLDSGRRPRKAWNIMRAFPYKWSGPELRADASDVAFESVELNHQGLEQVSL